MSEVLIRMKMPQCCEECRFFAWKRGVGQHCAVDDRITFHATLDGFDVGYERNGDCPLVLVPPHGRLIDADALIADLKQQCKAVWRTDAVSPDDYWITRNEAYNEALWKTWVESFFDYLQTRPRIIPAEDGE